MKNSPYLDRPLFPLAVALPRMQGSGHNNSACLGDGPRMGLSSV
jgi:hypothetical protein